MSTSESSGWSAEQALAQVQDFNGLCDTVNVLRQRLKASEAQNAALLAHRAQLEELIPALSDYSYKAALMAQLAPDEGTRNAFKKFGAAFGKVVAVLSSGEGSGDHP